MKKSINILLLVFAVCAFTSNMVFAQSVQGDPIPGTDVGLEHDPEGISMPTIKTDVRGKFSVKLNEGKYILNLSYYQIKRTLSGTDKNFASNSDGYIFTLLLGLMPNVKAPARVIINKENGPISISVAKGGGTLSGTLTYTKVDQNNRKR